MDWLDLLAVQGTLKSSPTPQFKSINSSVLGFLYSPTLTSIHDYWKNQSQLQQFTSFKSISFVIEVQLFNCTFNNKIRVDKSILQVIESIQHLFQSGQAEYLLRLGKSILESQLQTSTLMNVAFSKLRAAKTKALPCNRYSYP